MRNEEVETVEQLSRQVDALLAAPLPSCLVAEAALRQEVVGTVAPDHLGTFLSTVQPKVKSTRSGPPIYEKLLEKGRMAEERRLKRREEAILKELSTLEPTLLPHRAAISPKRKSHTRVEEKLLTRAKEREAQWSEYVERVKAERSEKELQSLTFRPQITNRGNRSRPKFKEIAANYRNIVLEKQEGAIAERFRKASDQQLQNYGRPSLSPHSRKLVAQRERRSRSDSPSHRPTVSSTMRSPHHTFKPEITRIGHRAEPRYSKAVSPRRTPDSPNKFRPTLNRKSVQIANTLDKTPWERLYPSIDTARAQTPNCALDDSFGDDWTVLDPFSTRVTPSVLSPEQRSPRGGRAYGTALNPLFRSVYDSL